MALIVPTILTVNQEGYKAFVASYYTFAKRVQIDITDGDFVAARTIEISKVRWPKDWEVDVHMMVSRPSDYVQTLIDLHPALVIFHAEVNEDLLPTMKLLKNNGIRAGVALLKPTFPGKVEGLIKEADHVLIFAGELGKQGGEADMMQIEKVELVRKINSAVEIGWDGGANMQNVRAIAHAGVDVIDVGGAIVHAPDPAEAFRDLSEEIDKRGVRL